MTLINGWATGRPIYHRLPVDCQQYQREPVDENDIIPADVLTDWFDVFLMASKLSVDNLFVDYLQPNTAKSSALDWLAQICGFTGEFWDATWDDTIKRQLIADSYRFIWPNRGNSDVLVYLIQLFQLPTYPLFNIYIVPYWLANITNTPNIAGRVPDQFFIRLLNTTIRDDWFWHQAKDFVKLYSPAWVNGVVCFDYWYAGSSAANDGVFDYIFEKTKDIATNWDLQNPELSCIDLVIYLASQLNISVEYITRNYWLANTTAPSAMVVSDPTIFYFVNESIVYTTWQWYTVNYLIDLYCSPLKSVVCTRYFKAGLSSIKQPVFEISGTLTTENIQTIATENNAIIITESEY